MYVAWWKLLVMLALFTPWWYVAPWVFQDSKSRWVRAPEGVWAGVVLGAGLVGVLAWLLLPQFFLGLAIYVLLTGASVMAYVVYRDSRVPENHKVLSGAFFSGLFAGGKKKPKGPQATEKVKIYRGDGGHIEPPPPENTAKVHAYNTVQDLLTDILWRRASAADVSPAGQEARVRLVIDGVVTDRPGMSAHDAEAAIQYLKEIGGMDPEERRRPQKGQIRADVLGEGQQDINLATAGTTGGQRLQIQVVREMVRTRLSELGMPPEMLERVTQIGENKTGLVIVSARSKNGQTSTLYSLLRQQDAFIQQLVTLESQPDVDLENVTQNTYDSPEALPGRLATALRLDPDVVMVDQCPNKETAQKITDASEDFFMLLGITASDSFSALAKWVQLAGAPGVRKLHAVLGQVLVRKLCTDCREAYRPDPAMLSKANLGGDEITQFYRPPTRPLTDEKGNPYTCPTCQGIGYVGRTAVFELLEITDEIRQLIASGASLTQIKQAARKNKMRYLQEQALRKVIDGTTSVQEVLRVTQQSKAKARRA